MEVCYTNEDAVILIPDISGFTRYVANSDIEHSQDKIAFLLESVLDNNFLDFEVSEIEGDAILFYKIKPSCSGMEILHQCRLMFTAFHQKLDELKMSGCKCRSCQGLDTLSLKFVIHYGKVGSIMVKNYCKLFGRDLIIAHRLLKNNINSKEYILFTESFDRQFKPFNTKTKDNMDRNQYQAEIGDIGKIRCYYMDVAEIGLDKILT